MSERKIDAKTLAAAMGIELPANCEVHFVVRSANIADQPMGGVVKVAAGEVVETRLRTAMAGSVATTWPSAPSVRQVV